MLALEDRSTRSKASWSKGEKQQQTQPTKLWRWRLDLNPGHTGGKRVRSILGHSLLPHAMKSSEIKLKQLNVIRLRVLDKFIVESKVLRKLLSPRKWSLFETSQIEELKLFADCLLYKSLKRRQMYFLYKSILYLQAWVMTRMTVERLDCYRLLSTAIGCYSDLEIWFKGKIL